MPREPAAPIDVPYLEGWMTLPDAAVTLGVTRQRVFAMVRERKLTTARKVSSNLTGNQPRIQYIVQTGEVTALRERLSRGVRGGAEHGGDRSP